MTEVFDGKSFQQTKLQKIKKIILENNLSLQLVSLLVGEDKASRVYTSLKKQACESVGIKMTILEFNEDTSLEILKKRILELNSDDSVNGIMIQVPLPENLKPNTLELINLIARKKDVDGMREDSNFVPATVKAVYSILEEAKASDKKVAVVGSRGSVGSRFKCDKGFDLGDDLNDLKNFDVVISVTGQANLIKPEMIKPGSVLIDVGAPEPEFNEECYKKAAFYTPVPGGVGPVTIASLVENVLLTIKG